MLLARCGCRSDFYCDAAIDEPQKTNPDDLIRLLRLVYCGASSPLLTNQIIWIRLLRLVIFNYAAAIEKKLFYCGAPGAIEERQSRKGYFSSIAALFYCGTLGAIEEKCRNLSAFIRSLSLAEALTSKYPVLKWKTMSKM